MECNGRCCADAPAQTVNMTKTAFLFDLTNILSCRSIHAASGNATCNGSVRAERAAQVSCAVPSSNLDDQGISHSRVAVPAQHAQRRQAALRQLAARSHSNSCKGSSHGSLTQQSSLDALAGPQTAHGYSDPRSQHAETAPRQSENEIAQQVRVCLQCSQQV